MMYARMRLIVLLQFLIAFTGLSFLMADEPKRQADSEVSCTNAEFIANSITQAMA